MRKPPTSSYGHLLTLSLPSLLLLLLGCSGPGSSVVPGNRYFSYSHLVDITV